MPEAYAQPHPDRANLSRRQGGPVAGCTKIRHGRRVCWEAGAFSVPPHPVRLQALGVFGLWALKALSVASLPGLASSPPIRKTTARLRHLALVLPLAAVIGMAVYGWRLSVAHDGLRAATTAQAGLRAMQLTDARADQIESLLNGVDIVLRQFRDHWAAGNPDAARATVQSALAAVPPDSIRNFAIASAEGALLFSMKPVQTPPDGPRTGVDRDYFKFHSRQAVDQSFLNPPVVGRALGAWVIQLTRPVLQDGRFDGVALVALSPHYLSAALAKTAVAPDDVISLVFNDGTFAARSRDLDKVLGTRLPADRSFFAAGCTRLRRGPVGGLYRPAAPPVRLASPVGLPADRQCRPGRGRHPGAGRHRNCPQHLAHRHRTGADGLAGGRHRRRHPAGRTAWPGAGLEPQVRGDVADPRRAVAGR